MFKSLTKSIIIASDHAGFLMKEKVKIFLNKSKIKSLDLGTFTEERVDYPDYAKKLALSVKKKSSFGILICGSGIGVSIAANRFKEIRAAVCYNQLSASLARKHNNANVLCLGARLISLKNVQKIVYTFISTKFEGGRHINRVKKLDK
ncbi:MAG: ribose 5-phosphate isomerase B [Pelagibacterales bacterium]|nr:ribose 5-phosphate isomerase B [Pelagibacterales bacterium]